MSNLAVQGGATGTGTVTLIAPVTSTNRTLTLPDATGTLITSEAVTAAGYTTPAAVLTQFNASGSAPVYAARAWVSFNATGTVSIRASGNVSSITDNGVGQYTVNITTAMSDVNYCWQINAQDGNDGMGVPTAQADPTRTITASALPIIYNYPPNASYYDANIITVTIFR